MKILENKEIISLLNICEEVIDFNSIAEAVKYIKNRKEGSDDDVIYNQ